MAYNSRILKYEKQYISRKKFPTGSMFGNAPKNYSMKQNI